MTGALNLWLIGDVLSTFSFGAIQAFVTQMSYGVILVLALLLTLLVPVLSRHISFVSPWSAFVVLGAIVASIVLHVATSAAYLPTEPVAAIAQGPLLDRYVLTAPAQAGLGLSPLQRVAFIAALAVVVLTFAARRMGRFLCLFVAALILALLALVAMQGDLTLFSGGTP